MIAGILQKIMYVGVVRGIDSKGVRCNAPDKDRYDGIQLKLGDIALRPERMNC